MPQGLRTSAQLAATVRSEAPRPPLNNNTAHAPSSPARHTAARPPLNNNTAHAPSSPARHTAAPSHRAEAGLPSRGAAKTPSLSALNVLRRPSGRLISLARAQQPLQAHAFGRARGRDVNVALPRARRVRPGLGSRALRQCGLGWCLTWRLLLNIWRDALRAALSDRLLNAGFERFDAIHRPPQKAHHLAHRQIRPPRDGHLHRTDVVFLLRPSA